MKWLERSVLFVLLAGLLMAPQTAQINTYVNGQVLTADQLNAEFGNLYSVINGLDEDNLLSTTSIPPAYITATINGQGLDRSGAGVLSVNGIISDGSAAAPGLRFNSDSNSGLYRIGADNVGFSLGGTLRLDIDTTDIVSTLPFRGPAGAVGAPALSFSTDSNTGWYNIGADNIGLATNGVLRWDVDTADITTTLVHLGPAGAVGAPTYSFSGDTDTGLYATAGALRTAVDGVEYLRVNSGGILLPTAGEQFVGQVGSAGTPSFSFSGDGNTGMYASAADTIAFSTGGTARVVISSSAATLGSGVGLTLNSGNITLSSGVITQSGTGGDTPHDCSRQSTTIAASGTQVSHTCTGPSEVVMGGGCDRGSGAMIEGYPTADNSWFCAFDTASTTHKAYAICCDY